jgi:hypothetical protein
VCAAILPVEQFLIQPTDSVLVNAAMILIVVLGVVLIVIGLSSKLLDVINRNRYANAVRHVSIGFHSSNKYVLIVSGIVLLVVSVAAFSTIYEPSTITVGSGYVDVKFTTLSLIPFVGGEKNITANEISTAYVSQIGLGALSLDKQYGTNYGNTNIGVYKLGNGATAYIASTNSTDLIIQLKNGEYVIVGTSNTAALARSFSENVCELKLPN